MNDDTRLREGLAPRGDDGRGPPRSGGTSGAGHSPAAVTGVYAALGTLALQAAQGASERADRVSTAAGRAVRDALSENGVELTSFQKLP